MRIINPKHIDAILELANSGPYFMLLGMVVSETGPGYSKVEMELQRKHFNPFGAIHGGVYSSLIDTAAYWSIYCEMDEHIGFTTIDLSVNNLSMVQEGKIVVYGKSIKIGRSVCLAEARAEDESGKLLAYGTSKLLVLSGKQSIEQAIEAMGHQPLPPKFIE